MFRGWLAEAGARGGGDTHFEGLVNSCKWKPIHARIQCRRMECGGNVQGQKWPTYVRFGPFWVRSSLTERPFGRPPPPPPKPAPERGANASLGSPLLRRGLTPPCRAPSGNHRFPNGFSTFSRGATFSMGHFFFSAIHSSLFSFLAHLTFQCGLQ